MNRKVLLMILDGWGEGRKDASNAIYTQGTPFIDSLRAKYPFSHLQACGIVNDHASDCPRYHEIVRDYPTVRKRRDAER